MGQELVPRETEIPRGGPSRQRPEEGLVQTAGVGVEVAGPQRRRLGADVAHRREQCRGLAVRDGPPIRQQAVAERTGLLVPDVETRMRMIEEDRLRDALGRLDQRRVDDRGEALGGFGQQVIDQARGQATGRREGRDDGSRPEFGMVDDEPAAARAQIDEIQ